MQQRDKHATVLAFVMLLGSKQQEECAHFQKSKWCVYNGLSSVKYAAQLLRPPRWNAILQFWFLCVRKLKVLCVLLGVLSTLQKVYLI